MSYVFEGVFTKVAQSTESIKNADGSETLYYSIILSNGYKVFNVTAGINADISNVEIGMSCKMYFDVIEKNGRQKLKVVKVEDF